MTDLAESQTLPARTTRCKLLQRIQRRYQTITEPLSLNHEILFTRIADPNRVLDQVAAEEDRREKQTGVRLADPLHLPYWAELWDSANALAQVLSRENPSRPITAKSRVMDLGCGMGLAGTAAAARGAHVLFADLESPALLFARLNSLPFAARVRARRVDWRSDRLNESFDLILGADIIYDRKQWQHLQPFWRAHLAPSGEVLLAEPQRQSGDEFIPWIKSQGWQVQTQEEFVSTRTRPIRLIQLSNPFRDLF